MKKIISIICLVCLLMSLLVVPVKAASAPYATYKIKQILDEDEIKGDSAKDYIIVYDNDGDLYALASTDFATGSYCMGTDNSEMVRIDGDELYVYSSKNILWTFTKSTQTVNAGDDKPALESSVSVFDGDDSKRKQLEFGQTNTSKNPAGITYKQNSYGFNLKFYDDGTTRMQQNGVEEKFSYLRFYAPDERFLSSKLGNSSRVKIYEVSRSYKNKSNFELEDVETNPVYPNPGSVKLDKYATPVVNYPDRAVANVTLKVDGTRINKDVDVVLIIDDSNSVHQTIEGTETRRVDIIREMTVNFAKSILELNPNNRIGIIRFAGDINYLDDTMELGLSNDINKIEELIMRERDNTEGGTNYTRAFEQANILLEEDVKENRDTVAIFISDGAPSIYNRIKYTVYKNTDDGIVGNHATNWVNYISNTELYEKELMEESGVKIYTIGSDNTTRAITSNGAFVITSEDTKPLLEKLSTEKSFFYDWTKLEEELDNIYEEISKDFYIVPGNAVVKNTLGKEVRLLTKTLDGVEPIIRIKNGEKLIEEITIKNNGTEAYSNLSTENVLTLDENGKMNILTSNFTYTEETKKMVWNIGDVFPDQFSLEYPVYLTQTVNMYEDGENRETGNYDVSQEAVLEYTNHLNEPIQEDFPIPEIEWKKENSVAAAPSTPEPAPSPVINENGDTVKTGDNVDLYIYSFMGLAVTFFILSKIKKMKNK